MNPERCPLWVISGLSSPCRFVSALRSKADMARCPLSAMSGHSLLRYYREHCPARDERRARCYVNGCWQQCQRDWGSTNWPLYVPPVRVSVKLSYMYVPPPLAPSNVPVPPVYLYVYSLRCEPSSQVSY